MILDWKLIKLNCHNNLLNLKVSPNTIGHKFDLQSMIDEVVSRFQTITIDSKKMRLLLRNGYT